MMTLYPILCVGSSVVASLEPLAHHRNVASLSLFYRYYFRRCSYELAGLVSLRHSCSSSTRYSTRSPFLDVKRISMSTVSFLAQLNSGILCPHNAFL